jgi:hypothetical protein
VAVGVGVPGYGYWGPNMPRNLAKTEGLVPPRVTRPGSTMKEASGRQCQTTLVRPRACVCQDPRNPLLHAVVIRQPYPSHPTRPRAA